jgi:hypothetical protein
MGIKNLDGLSNQDLVDALQGGGKFVVYSYTISILVMTFRLGSPIYFISPSQRPVKYGLKYLLISAILGWWGFPWGAIYTIQSFLLAFRGKDVTKEVMAQLARGIASEAVNYEKKF